MKPDYVKIIFIGIPLSFIFWFVSFLCASLIFHDADMSTFVGLISTVIFVIIYLYLAVKYAKQLKVIDGNDINVAKNAFNKPLSKSSGIISLVYVVTLITVLAIGGIFFENSKMKLYKVIAAPLAVIAIFIERYFLKRA